MAGHGHKTAVGVAKMRLVAVAAPNNLFERVAKVKAGIPLQVLRSLAWTVLTTAVETARCDSMQVSNPAALTLTSPRVLSFSGRGDRSANNPDNRAAGNRTYD